MNTKTCCVTGHRDFPQDNVNTITTELRKEIIFAIEQGYNHFISGFAAGVDLIFADIVAELKEQYHITLEAAIPYLGRIKTPDADFQRLIKLCDVVKSHSERYSKDCYMKRNRYMIEQSALVIAVWDGRQTGGTAATVRYAKKQERIVKICTPPPCPCK